MALHFWNTFITCLTKIYFTIKRGGWVMPVDIIFLIMENFDNILIKEVITYHANMTGLLLYLVIKVFNFIKNVFLPLVFLTLIFFFQFRGFFIFLFLYSIPGSGLSWYFIFIAEFLFLFFIEFLIIFLACKVQLTLLNWVWK